MRLVPLQELGMDKSANEMFSIMEKVFGNSLQQTETKASFRLDVLEKDNAYVVVSDLPGVLRDKITISFDKEMLKISVAEVENDQEIKYIHRERKHNAMERVIKLKEIDTENIVAKLENGILTITLSKKEIVETKMNIEIQ
jgi:HSP20 family protein